MKTLLAVVYNHFEFLYLDPRYRITDSSTGGVATNDATLRLTTPFTSFWFSNDRGQVLCDVAPTKSDSTKNSFYIPLVRQYLVRSDETEVLPSRKPLYGSVTTSAGYERSSQTRPSPTPARNCPHYERRWPTSASAQINLRTDVTGVHVVRRAVLGGRLELLSHR